MCPLEKTTSGKLLNTNVFRLPVSDFDYLKDSRVIDFEVEVEVLTGLHRLLTN